MERRERSSDFISTNRLVLDHDRKNERESKNTLEEDSLSDAEKDTVYASSKLLGNVIVNESQGLEGDSSDADSEIDTGISDASNETESHIIEKDNSEILEEDIDDADNEKDGQVLEKVTTSRKKYRRPRKRIFIDQNAKEKMLVEKMKVKSILEHEHLDAKEDELT